MTCKRSLVRVQCRPPTTLSTHKSPLALHAAALLRSPQRATPLDRLLAAAYDAAQRRSAPRWSAACYSELIVVDDIGLLPAGADEAEARYRLVDAAYEKRSLILTSNLHPGRFDTISPRGLATAAVDRLLHHAHVVVTEGQSKRLADALEGRGVTPLKVPPNHSRAGR